MYVSHFNSFLRGGAATAARQLHRALLRRGIKSRFQHLPGEKDAGEVDQRQATQNGQGGELLNEELHATHFAADDPARQIANRVRFRVHRQRFKRAIRRGDTGSEVFTSPHGQAFTPWPPIDHLAAKDRQSKPQIVHLHWISKFIDFPSFFGSLGSQQPVVWTLHDMNALTGGCHFSGGCQRFRLGCGNCPQLRRPSQNDVSARSFEMKRKALQEVNLHIAAPSRWLLKLAKSSPLLADAKSFSLIPYGMPTDRLYPMEKRFAREALGIKPDGFTIGFGAMNLQNRRKGTRELIAALRSIGPNSGIRCLVFGSGSLGEEARDLPETIEVGHVSDDRTRRLVYSAADAFVLPSTEDNLPLTGLEAMACGTPVIGFAAGGIPDYVLPGKTGMLAENGNSDQLAQRLRTARANPSAMSEMGEKARQLIDREFYAELEAERYGHLYQRLLSATQQSDRRAA